MQGFPEYGLKEQEAVTGLLAKNPTDTALKQSVLACLSSQCLWLQHSQEFKQSVAIAKQLLCQGLAWKLTQSGWEMPLQACFGVLQTLLKHQEWRQADSLMRTILSTFQQLGKQPAFKTWVQIKIQLFGYLWQETVEHVQETRTWQQRLLFIPTIRALLKSWGVSTAFNESLSPSSITIEGVQSTYYDGEPTWLAQACFQACLQQNTEAAERFYQQHQRVIQQSDSN